jgi:type I restriction enzyme M protein
MNTQQLYGFLFNLADTVPLRGTFESQIQGRVILPFTVLRRLDCILQPHKATIIEEYNKFVDKVDDPSEYIISKIGIPYFNHSEYDLKTISEDSENVEENFKNYLSGFSKQVTDFLENFTYFNDDVKELTDAGKLHSMIKECAKADLHPETLDNHMMGTLYEQILTKYSEDSNQESGDHYTPRDVVKLLVELVFDPEKEALKESNLVRSIYDPCCGTGGMLTIGKKWIQDNINKDIKISLHGQELNKRTYAMCKADMLMLNEPNPEYIKGPFSSLKDDKFKNEKFYYTITNPPFGVKWTDDKAAVMREKDDPNGRFSAGVPGISDGALLFLQHCISKMKSEGARIGIVLNGSPSFTGDAGRGESNIRKYIFENDLLETIVALPENMFFRTGITTYLWILTNKKSPSRKGKVQLIDASNLYSKLKKSIGKKMHDVDEDCRKKILSEYRSFEESEISKVYPNEFFGYTKVTVHQPLLDDDDQIIRDKKGNPKPDPSKKDHERIPLLEDIDDYFLREVKPQLPDAWMDPKSKEIGYEINFTKYFYKFTPLRSLESIAGDLQVLDNELSELSKDIL